MIEDSQPVYSFDAFNFGWDQSLQPEMALARELWQEFDEASENEPGEQAENTDTEQPKSVLEPNFKDILPATVLDLGFAFARVFPSFTNFFGKVPTRTAPLEICSISDAHSFDARAVQGNAPTISAHQRRRRSANGFAFRQFDLKPSSWIDQIAKAVSRHEGRADSINWNDNGAGISAGMFQANQRRGELPNLLHRMVTANPPLFAHYLGDRYADMAKFHPEKFRQVAFTNSSGNGPNNLGLQLREALRQPFFQQVQLDMLQEKIVHAAKVANAYGIKSARGIALVADLINQLGEGGGNSSCGAKYYLRFALSQNSEAEKIRNVVNHDLKGYGRLTRDKDILLDPHLDNRFITEGSVLFDPTQSAQTKAIAIHTKTNHNTSSYI